MEPSFIHRCGDVLDHTARGQAATYLLTQTDNLEVSRYELPPSTPLEVSPPDDPNDGEIFYLLSGHLQYRNDGLELTLEPGDCIAAHEVEGSAYFETAEEATLLQITSLPSFSHTAETNRRFYEMAEQIEADEHMEGHSKRLEFMALQLGHRLGISGEAMFHLRSAAFFHDIGKAKVPQHIIQKPVSLTDEEWETVKRHSEWGREILEEQPEFEEVGRIVEQIHERVDGGGYPHGLTGDETRLEAKIVAVVDAYDAMTTDRPYRKAMANEDALAELRANAGTQFDPDVVTAFVTEFRKHPPADTPPTTEHDIARWSQTEHFLELGERILAGQDLDTLLHNVVSAITEHTPFQRAAMALYDRPIEPESIEQVRIERTAHSGLTPEEEAQLQANPLPPEERKKVFQDEFRLSRSYYIPVDRNPWGKRSGFIAGRLESTEGNWYPDDMLVIPMWLPEGQLIGLISVDDPSDGRAPTPKTIEPLEMLANLAALAIQKDEDIYTLQDYQQRLQGIYQLSESLGTASDTEELARLAVLILTEHFQYHFAAVLLTEGNQLVQQSYATQLPIEEFTVDLDQRRIALGDGITGWVARHGKSDLVADAREDDRYLAIHPELRSELAVPVVDDGRVIGVLTIENCQPHAFAQADLDLLQVLSRQLAMAISNVRRREAQAWTNRFFRRLNAAESIDELLVEVLEQALAYLRPMADAGNVLYYNESHDRFEFRVAVNRDWAKLKLTMYERDELLDVLNEREPTFLTRSYQRRTPVTRRLLEETGVSVPGSTMCIPIRDPEQDELLAFLNLNNLEAEDVFTELDAAAIEPLLPEITTALVRARDREHLHRQATHDPLTDVYNRHYFSEYIATEQARAQRYGHPVSLLMLDIDGFHKINDRFGHAEGDRVLCEVAQNLQRHVRDADTVVRYGGDEFLIIMPEIDHDGGQQAGERIRQKLAHAEFGVPDPIVTSIGVATWSPGEGRDFAEVLEDADRWMYRRKRRKTVDRD